MWQGSTPFDQVSPPRKPPSPEVLAKPDVEMPSSAFVPDYSHTPQGRSPPFKATVEQGSVRLVANFPQGYSGPGAEKYPSGQTYAGGYVGAKRHGTGTYQTNDGALVSNFRNGRPVGEGVHYERGPQGYSQALRTHAGKVDGKISKTEAGLITRTIKSPPKPAAVTPQVWTLNKASSGTYVTEAKAQYAYVGPADNFLTKLAAAEAKDSVSAEDAKAAPNRVRMDLIPKVAKSPPKKPRGR